MSRQIEIEDSELKEMAIWTYYLELVNLWLDKQEGIISISEANKKIQSTIKTMNNVLELFPEQFCVKKYFIIDGSGWLYYNPIENDGLNKAEKNMVVSLRTGTHKFINPDMEFYGVKDFNEKSPEELLQIILDKTRDCKATEEEIKQDWENIRGMEALLDEMEKDINKQREEEAKTPEEKLFDELLENEEVQKIYKKIKEGKMKEEAKVDTESETPHFVKEEIEPTPEEVVEEATKEAEEELKQEEAKVEEDAKETEEDKQEKKSIAVKVAIGVAATAVVIGLGYFLKNKLLKK